MSRTGSKTRIFLQNIRWYLYLAGIDPRTLFRSLKGLPFFIRDYRTFMSQRRKEKADFPLTRIYPFLSDRFSESGNISGHYFQQDLLVAQMISEKRPRLHVDIGSRIDGFVAHVATFREIEVFDIRPLAIDCKNIIFRQFDLSSREFPLADYCDSISSLHAIEHFGLGRYGDRVDCNAHLTALDNIYKMLKKDGTFYFSVPVGPQRIEFNANKVFDIQYLLTLFRDRYTVKSFSYIDDSGRLFRNVKLHEDGISGNFGCFLGCGIFELQKI